jgi:HEAT repeat protein
MTVRRLLGTCALVVPALVALPGGQMLGAAAGTIPLPPAPWVADDPADSLYRVAREALNRNEYRQAAALFGQITDRYPGSAYAADALYWRAFALYRAGREDDLRAALASLDVQRTRFPRAGTRGDADALAVRIRGSLARGGDASSAEAVTTAARETTRCGAGGDGDDEGDVRAAALNALMQMDAERALPIIKQVLQRRDACSAPLRRKAVFLLSQKRTSGTESLLMDVYRGDPSRDVREQAVFWLGQIRTDQAAAALEEIATSAPDVEMRSRAVFAIGEQHSARGEALIRRLAESRDTPVEVRDQAIFRLGQRRSAENAEFLRGLFGRLGKGDENAELRKRVLFSLSQMRGVGNERWLLDLALDQSQDTELRKHALWTAGQAGVGASELVALYDRLGDRPLKEQLIWVLSESRDRVASDKLVEIARSDRDVEMRKKAIFWLGQKNDPRIQQILIDILTKG